jgi:radical SAM/Cys-rich protein
MPSKSRKSFSRMLSDNHLELKRRPTTTLQINMGLVCNQNCRHCHLEAGPHRSESMAEQTVRDLIPFIQRGPFQILDITGGAPELNPNLFRLIKEGGPWVQKIFLRSNLTALYDGDRQALIELLQTFKVVIFASLPSANGPQADLQRGPGTFEKSLRALQALNSIGYGQPGSDLELNLAVNPVGAFLPSSQEQTERKFREDLERKWGVIFNHLYTFINVPLGRFRQWLEQSNNLKGYLEKLTEAFNPSTLENVMCRTTISVDWNGHLFDCDFNLSQGLFLGGRKTHFTKWGPPVSPEAPIVVSDHCYACTAGAGFT